MTTATDSAAADSDDSRKEFDRTTPQASLTAANRVTSQTLTSNVLSARHALIAEAAYRRAKKRGFVEGTDWQDWLDAEREVNAHFDSNL
jgi:hypothetical protein